MKERIIRKHVDNGFKFQIKVFLYISSKKSFNLN